MLWPLSPAQRHPRPSFDAGGKRIPDQRHARKLKFFPKTTAYRTGVWAEAACCLALFLKGYRIVATRYRSKLDEVDIIAARGPVLAFVEVKARGRESEAAEAIAPRQRARLVRAAADFIARHPRYCGHVVRFDAMLVLPRRWPAHLPGAWDAEAGRGLSR